MKKRVIIKDKILLKNEPIIEQDEEIPDFRNLEKKEPLFDDFKQKKSENKPAFKIRTREQSPNSKYKSPNKNSSPESNLPLPGINNLKKKEKNPEDFREKTNDLVFEKEKKQEKNPLFNKLSRPFSPKRESLLLESFSPKLTNLKQFNEEKTQNIEHSQKNISPIHLQRDKFQVNKRNSTSLSPSKRNFKGFSSNLMEFSDSLSPSKRFVKNMSPTLMEKSQKIMDNSRASFVMKNSWVNLFGESQNNESFYYPNLCSPYADKLRKTTFLPILTENDKLPEKKH